MIDIGTQTGRPVDLPSAPGVIRQLTTIMSDDGSSTREIARLVETDQAFTARTLKLVNSSFYGFARQIRSVEEAVTMLGLGTLQQLLLATTVVRDLGTDTAVLPMDEFWLHSCSVGVMTKHLLGNQPSEAKNEAFMCGVLHDIGRLLFVKDDPARYTKFFEEGGSVIDRDKEVEWFGADHQQIGQALAQAWNFPESFAIAIAFHHNPEEAPRSQRLVAAIHIADVICHALGLGYSGTEFITTFSPSAWEVLELDRERLSKRAESALTEIHETEALIKELG